MGGRGTSAKPTGRTAHFSANRGSSIQARWTDPGNRDRKSTRLNSSHGYISYAVFCLKKTVPDSLNKIFRDRNDFGSGGRISEDIDDALKASEHLIVLCSPNSAQSVWANHEVESFLGL